MRDEVTPNISIQRSQPMSPLGIDPATTRADRTETEGRQCLCLQLSGLFILE